MKQNNNWCCNWCCEIIKNTISLFKPGDNFFNKEGYCDINERYFLLYFYGKKSGFEKKVCDNCQKLGQAEKDKLAKEDKEGENEQEEELKNRKCANYQKEITVGRYKKMSEAGSEEPNEKNTDGKIKECWADEYVKNMMIITAKMITALTSKGCFVIGNAQKS